MIELFINIFKNQQLLGNIHKNEPINILIGLFKWEKRGTEFACEVQM